MKTARTAEHPMEAKARRSLERDIGYLERAAHTIKRIKERRGYSLYEPLPGGGGDWNTRHCGKEGCPCTHGKFRSQGDYCDRGFIPTCDDPDGERRTARCPALVSFLGAVGVYTVRNEEPR